MQLRRRGGTLLRQGLTLLLLLLLTSCSRSVTPVSQPVFSPPPSSMFPPQKVMKDDNYAAFLAENEGALQRCGEQTECDIVLFNLGFIYGYPQSPYRDRAAALWYFDELQKNYPQSPWAFQAQAWTAFINESLALEESRRQLRAHLHTREERIRTLRQQLQGARQIDIEMDEKERELLR
jgi:hypothetical protein